MPKPREEVVIQEPPMEEFGKKHSCIKRTCLSGCGCFFIFIIGALILINYATNERERSLKNIPETVKKNVPIYDEQNIESIKFLSGEEKQKKLGLIAIFPKMLLSPMIVQWPEKFLEKPEHGGRAAHLANIKAFLKLPVGQNKDIITLEWKNLSAEPKFIEEYYTNELTKSNFTLENAARTASSSQILFQKEEISGTLSIQDTTPKTEGTDTVLLKVHMKTK